MIADINDVHAAVGKLVSEGGLAAPLTTARFSVLVSNAMGLSFPDGMYDRSWSAFTGQVRQALGRLEKAALVRKNVTETIGMRRETIWVSEAAAQEKDRAEQAEGEAKARRLVLVREVLAGATGCVQEWLPGWTEPADGEPQRKIVLNDAGDHHVDITVEGAPYTDEEDRRFRIALSVTELP